LHAYKKKVIMKHIKSCKKDLKGWRQGYKKVTEVVNMIKAYYMHVWIYHNETLALYK
jgi:hypothetical protein